MHDEVARELIRAVRGARSQRQLARRLGYRSNPVSEWEGGRRWPTAAEFLRVCEVCGLDVTSAVAAFASASAPSLVADDAAVAAWLRAIRGQTSVAEMARRLGVSRSSLSRWMAGIARPRLPAFLGLIDACTGRLADFVAALVPVDTVPSMKAAYAQSRHARRLLFDHPWAVAIWACLQTSADPDPVALAQALQIPIATVLSSLDALVAAGVLVPQGAGYAPGPGRLVVDTDAVPGGPDALRRHWTAVAMSRLGQPASTDQFGYAVFGVSRDDLVRIRELHRAYYRQVRAIAADSAPSEVVALLNLQLVQLSRP